MPTISRENIKFKEVFLNRYKQLLGKDLDLFLEYSTKFLRRSIRINTLKISIEELKSRLEKDWLLQQIPFCNQGFYIEHIKKERRDIGNLIEHSLGYFYIQEAASMIPPLVLAPEKNDLVLDLCAAPGSKTTQLSALMENQGLIIANDLEYKRLKPLIMNLQRCGCLNVITTLSKGYNIKDLKFDKILVDAPCSATGAIRKSLKTLQMYNPSMIKRLAGAQKKLLANAFNLLKEDGTLVYSTCSLEPDEDESVIDFLLNNFKNAKLEEIKIENLKSSPVILEFENKRFNPEIEKCLRIWPQDNDSEGFFIAKIKKV